MKWLSLDTDIFSDPKIKTLLRKCSGDGYTIYNYILTRVAGNIDIDNNENGYLETGNGEDPAESIAWDLHFDENEVQDTLDILADLGLIDLDSWDNDRVFIPKLLERKQAKIYLSKQEGGRKGGASSPSSTPSRSPSNSPSTDIDKDREVDKEKNNNIPYSKIIDYLNIKADRQFKSTTPATKRKIEARWNEGFDFDDFKNVIDTKVAEWKDDEEMELYLRPKTLFGTKFEGYLNQPMPGSKPKKSRRPQTNMSKEEKEMLGYEN